MLGVHVFTAEQHGGHVPAVAEQNKHELSAACFVSVPALSLVVSNAASKRVQVSQASVPDLHSLSETVQSQISIPVDCVGFEAALPNSLNHYCVDCLLVDRHHSCRSCI